MGDMPNVVCVSRAVGGGGEILGRLVSEQLGFRYVDEEIVARAASKADVPADLVADAEVRKSLLRRLLPEIGSDMATMSLLAGVTPPTGEASDDYRQLIQQAIVEVAAEGEVVIVAHAASLALANRTAVLRVLVTAPPEARAHRLVEELGLTLEAARKSVADSDRDRADYFKRFYRTEELPTHYDLVVNTENLTPEQAAGVVLAACSTRARGNSWTSHQPTAYAAGAMGNRGVKRGVIVAKIKPGAEEKVAEIFAASDRTELPALAGVVHRSLFVLDDVYVHYVETDEDFEAAVDQIREHPLFREISAQLEEYVIPYNPETWRSPKDATAREFYSWDSES